MTFVSYAQNFEDVLLWRALREVPDGFYIDVGAAHPDVDSVTRAFYDRGWRGINIEPVEAFFRRLEAARRRDVNLRVAAGAEAGEADLFVIEGTGLSTLLHSVLAEAGEAGHGARPTRVRVETLAEICRRHATGAIHFLKIDAEGAEPAVLAGADFAAFRPWIVLVEATAPLSTAETHAAWEPILLAADYRFVWFDGLNRFYLAAERQAALARHFRVPPNVFDDFLRAADTEWTRRIVEAETQAAALRQRMAEAERRAGLAELRGQEVAALRATLARQEAQSAAVRQESRRAEEWLAAMRASTSWRVTAPLRRAAELLSPTLRRERGSGAPVSPVSPPPAPEPPAAAATATPRSASWPVPARAVHQFHAGSAVGDAITNAMLLTRRLLRELGFASEIFVAHRDQLLAHELRPLDELPQHPDYVLIVRHSMGFDAFDRIAALPAAKVLLYHNITPPGLLTEPLRRYAKLGREQLARWRPLVAAALADSEYNAIELRALGFDPVRTCTLLFDPAALCRSTSPRPSEGATAPFTILFVGRVSEAKGQRELLAAYARFRAEFRRPARLVLVGRHDGDGYAAELSRAIEAGGLAGEVLLPGLVSDAALHGWYAAADLYVSLSGHEGFGVPLVEAMAHGVPVLAWPSGAVPYTLGGAGELLPGRDPAAVAAAMLALAADPARRAAIAERQRRSLGRFGLERQVPVLLAALARAGAVPAEGEQARALLAANLQFTVTGHVRGSYSLARVNRALAATLEAHCPGRVRLVPAPDDGDPGQPVQDFGVPPEDQAPIARLAARPPPVSGPHMVLSQHYPVLVPDERGDALLAFFFWEESLIPAETVALLNRHFRAVLAPSVLVAKTLLDSGVSLPVRNVGHAPPLARFARLAAERAARPRRDGAFTFLHVSSCFPRKGVDVLLAAYAQAFRRGDPVRLVIKGFPNPHNGVAAQVARLAAADPEAAEIVFVNRDMDEDELVALFRDADALVLPSRGEGFNLPAAEGMAAGVPVIVTGFGGHMDFCDAGTARLVAFRFAPSASHLATAHSVWAEPDQADLAAALREAADPPCFGNRENVAAAARAGRAQRHVAGLADGVAARVAAAALDVLLAPPPPPLRIAWVSTWGVRCGIAEYSRHLLAALLADGDDEAVGSISVFADRRTAAVLPEATGPAVIPAWEIGAAGSMAALAAALAAADPHAIVVQHQPGLFGWDALAALLEAPALCGRTVAATLHNTRHLLEAAAAERGRAVAALSRIARVLVHTPADLDRLRSLGLLANVTLLPHGALLPQQGPPGEDRAPPRPLPPGTAPLIGCYGFFLPGKGIPQLIAALAKLRATWPAARLRLVNAAYDDARSAAEIAACRAAAAAAGVAEAVQWETDFLPHEQSLARLAGCDVVALPYQGSQEASSAALRTALAAGAPVLVTPLPLFEEADDAVVRCAGLDGGAVADGLALLLADTALRARTRQAARNWLAARNWDAIAARLRGMLLGLHASRISDR